MIRFDAYTATTNKATHVQLSDLVQEAVGEPLTLQQGRGMHTFGHRLAMKDSTGIEVASIQWGGLQDKLSMIEVKGEHTPRAVEALRARYWHRVTRVDSCADFDAPGSFERLLGPCMEVKSAHRLKGERRGDWEDFPEEGRTQYLGAPTSVARLRLYEKGKQPEYRHLGRSEWVRIEVQVRPSKDAKASFNQLDASQVWGASKWTRDLASKVLKDHIDPHPAGTVYRKTERDRVLSWMCKQYGAHLSGLASDLGSWECVGLTLAEMIKEGANSLRQQ